MAPPPRTVYCLGNPGPEYSTTRHNVGWWFAERLADRYALGRFRQEGRAGIARGEIERIPVQVVKPLTYMNRSGDLLVGAAQRSDFDLVADLLVVVDEVALDPGRARFRGSGSAGGHNGLKSIQAALGTTEYSRLRIGVGMPPPNESLVDWVLSPPPAEERKAILDSMDRLVEGVGLWVLHGLTAAMNHCNS